MDAQFAHCVISCFYAQIARCAALTLSLYNVSRFSQESSGPTKDLDGCHSRYLTDVQVCLNFPKRQAV